MFISDKPQYRFMEDLQYYGSILHEAKRKTNGGLSTLVFFCFVLKALKNSFPYSHSMQDIALILQMSKWKIIDQEGLCSL